MKAVIAYLAFIACVISAPYLADKLVDWQFAEPKGSDFNDQQRAALDALIDRSLREAEEHARESKRKLSLSEQALIMRDLYGY